MRWAPLGRGGHRGSDRRWCGGPYGRYGPYGRAGL